MAGELAKQDDLDIGVDMSDMMMIVMMVMMMSVLTSTTAQSAQSAQSAQTLQAQSFEGLTYSRVLHAGRLLQWENLVVDPPYTPLVSVAFHNDGPDSVFIAINNPDELQEVAVGEDYSVDMLGSIRRIEFIFYKTSSGAASIRTVGKY